MTERPILFSGPMVQALRAGRKTQTRRVVKPPPPAGHSWAGWCISSTHRADEGKATWALGEGPLMRDAHRVHCPHGRLGDRLWVRETFAPVTVGYAYAADPIWTASPAGKWRPSIHMPRAASRITLEITEVRVERLQSISDVNLECEGLQEVIDAGVDHDGYPRDAWRALWSSINGADSWDANPWVWAVSFRPLAPTT